MIVWYRGRGREREREDQSMNRYIIVWFTDLLTYWLIDLLSTTISCHTSAHLSSATQPSPPHHKSNRVESCWVRLSRVESSQVKPNTSTSTSTSHIHNHTMTPPANVYSVNTHSSPPNTNLITPHHTTSTFTSTPHPHHNYNHIHTTTTPPTQANAVPTQNMRSTCCTSHTILTVRHITP